MPHFQTSSIYLDWIISSAIFSASISVQRLESDIKQKNRGTHKQWTEGVREEERGKH